MLVVPSFVEYHGSRPILFLNRWTSMRFQMFRVVYFRPRQRWYETVLLGSFERKKSSTHTTIGEWLAPLIVVLRPSYVGDLCAISGGACLSLCFYRAFVPYSV